MEIAYTICNTLKLGFNFISDIYFFNTEVVEYKSAQFMNILVLSCTYLSCIKLSMHKGKLHTVETLDTLIRFDTNP
jgi:hypothetical protein